MLNDVIQELRAQQATEAKPVVSRRLYEALRDGWMEARTISFDAYPDLPNIYFRASELHLLCPRLVALARRQPIVQVFDAETLWTFDLGHGYHHALQRGGAQIAGGTFLGWWKRYEGDRKIVVKGAEGGVCPRPEGDDWAFEEVLLVDEKLHLCGHGDGVIEWADGGRESQEFKSIHSRFVNRINPAVGGVPVDKHVAQVHAYMGMQGVDRYRITYAIKTSDPMELVLFEHEGQRDERILDKQRELLGACAKARDISPKGLLPDKLAECNKASCPRAQRCPGRQRCFKAL